MPVIRHIAQLGNPVLRQLALPVDNLRDASLQTLIEDMLATVAEADGVGIAAPQVYEPLRLFIVASRPNPRYPDAPSMQPTVMLNPELLWQSPETVMGWEGCLSVPGIRGLVPRSERIRVGYQEHGEGVAKRNCRVFSPGCSSTSLTTSVAWCFSIGLRATATW